MNLIQQQQNPGLLSTALKMYAAYQMGTGLGGNKTAPNTPATSNTSPTPTASTPPLAQGAQFLNNVNQATGINTGFSQQMQQQAQQPQKQVYQFQPSWPNNQGFSNNNFNWGGMGQ